MATIEDLITAVEEGDEDEVKEALKESPAIVFKADPATGLRALHVAAWRGDGDVARILLKNGAEIDWQDEKYGNTALIWAAYRGYTDVSAAPPWPARAAPLTARCRAAVPPPPRLWRCSSSAERTPHSKTATGSRPTRWPRMRSGRRRPRCVLQFRFRRDVSPPLLLIQVLKKHMKARAGGGGDGEDE